MLTRFIVNNRTMLPKLSNTVLCPRNYITINKLTRHNMFVPNKQSHNVSNRFMSSKDNDTTDYFWPMLFGSVVIISVSAKIFDRKDNPEIYNLVHDHQLNLNNINQEILLLKSRESNINELTIKIALLEHELLAVQNLSKKNLEEIQNNIQQYETRIFKLYNSGSLPESIKSIEPVKPIEPVNSAEPVKFAEPVDINLLIKEIKILNKRIDHIDWVLIDNELD